MSDIPPSLRAALEGAPSDRGIALLLRHAAREALPPDFEAAYRLPITAAGRRDAVALGRWMGGRLRTLHTSPLTRCVHTAGALRDGAGVDVPVVPDRMLGDPGVYVVDDQVAGGNWARLGPVGVVEHLMTDDTPLPGMASPAPAARALVAHMLAVADRAPGLHVFVTHDSVIAITAARMLGRRLGRDAWPGFLEAMGVWRKGADGVVGFGGRVAILRG